MTQSRRLELPGSSSSVAEARRVLISSLEAWGLAGNEQLMDDAALIVSELTTNAVRFGSEAVELSLELRDDVLEISVSDNSPMLPVVRHPDADDLSGRGLPILAALSESWGYEISGDRKRVWGWLSTAQDPGGEENNDDVADSG